MNDDYILNECTDIYSSLESFEVLQFVNQLLRLLDSDFRFNLDTEKDKEKYKKFLLAKKILNELEREEKENE